MARDEMVQSAMDTRVPRFVSNGEDTNDFQRVTRSVERGDDWSRKWSECGMLGEQAEANGYDELACRHQFQAAIGYHFGKYLFVRTPQELRVAHEEVVGDSTRALPTFECPGERVAIAHRQEGKRG